MIRLFETLKKELSAGRGCVMASILASSGSTPRGAGAKMVVLEDGSTVGTVGGGAVELHATELAKQALIKRENAVQGFILRKNDVADIGMVCGGDVTVYFQYFDPADQRAAALISDADRPEIFRASCSWVRPASVRASLMRLPSFFDAIMYPPGTFSLF